MCSNRYNLKKHERDMHLNRGAKFVCDLCNRQYSSLNSLQVHRSNSHPTGVVRRRSSIGPLHLGLPQQPPPPSLSTSLPTSLPTSQPQPQLSPQHQQQQQLPAQLQAPIPLPHPQQMIKFQPDEYPPPQPMREDMLHQPPPVFEVDADPSDAAAIAALFRKTLRT
ncbi:tyrosine-protein phosphatase non-receptor type 23-like [Penaeus indicus]|uniref:tyrosine-protein phosphatase non-receptor type 23-like n=1 Tax=Penaeus indicus TaxID=29960 RepID=UPI00300D20A4